MEHFVITVARETGSGGHDITRKLSQQLNIPYYDRDLLRKASEVSGIHERLFGAADERIGWKEMLSAAERSIPARNGGTPRGTICRWTPSSWTRMAAWSLSGKSCRCLPERGAHTFRAAFRRLQYLSGHNDPLGV